jgi:hypothetical protein
MRYLKVYWPLYTYLHIISGWYILIMTYVIGFLSLQKNSWEVDPTLGHDIIGIVILAVVLIIVILGLYTRISLKN